MSTFSAAQRIFTGVLDVTTEQFSTAIVDGDLTVGGSATVDTSKVSGVVTQNAGVVVTMPPDKALSGWVREADRQVFAP